MAEETGKVISQEAIDELIAQIKKANKRSPIVLWRGALFGSSQYLSNHMRYETWTVSVLSTNVQAFFSNFVRTESGQEYAGTYSGNIYVDITDYKSSIGDFPAHNIKIDVENVAKVRGWIMDNGYYQTRGSSIQSQFPDAISDHTYIQIPIEFTQDDFSVDLGRFTIELIL